MLMNAVQAKGFAVKMNSEGKPELKARTYSDVTTNNVHAISYTDDSHIAPYPPSTPPPSDK